MANFVQHGIPASPSGNAEHFWYAQRCYMSAVNKEAFFEMEKGCSVFEENGHRVCQFCRNHINGNGTNHSEGCPVAETFGALEIIEKIENVLQQA